MAHMHLYQVVMEVRQCQGPDAACLLAWYAWGGSIHALLRAIGGAPHPPAPLERAGAGWPRAMRACAKKNANAILV